MSYLTKRQKQLVMILALGAVIFSAIAFLVPFPKNGSFAIAYLAGLAAFALQIPIFKSASDNADDLISKVLNFPIMRVGYIYLGLQTALSLVLFALGFIPGFPAWLTALLCIIVICGAFICSTTAEIAAEEVKKIEYAAKADTRFMTELKVRSAALPGKVSDTALKNALEKLAENIRYSDPVTNKMSESFETSLDMVFTDLEIAVDNGETEKAYVLCGKVNSALESRNIACKNGK